MKAFESRLVKIVVVLLIVIPLLVSTFAVFRQYPKPAPGPSGADRFSQFSPLTPNYPNATPPQPPPELKDLLNSTIGRSERPDVFLRLRSGGEYVDGKRLPHYTQPTLEPSSVISADAVPNYIERNVSLESLISQALGVPIYVPSDVLFGNQTAVVNPSVSILTDKVRQLYPSATEGIVTYTLGIHNASLLSRATVSLPLSYARAIIAGEKRMLNTIPTSTTAQNVAQALMLPDDDTIYRQVGRVLQYMYAHVKIVNEDNLDNPLQCLDVGYATPDHRLTTFVVLLRLVGVPANVAYGFIPSNETENGLYKVYVKDFRTFVEIYDVNTRVLFDPRPFSAVMIASAGKSYPINVYRVDIEAEIVSVSGGDSVTEVNGTTIYVFNVTSQDYVNFLNVTAYAEVMGYPMAGVTVNASRYYVPESEFIANYTTTANDTGYAFISVEINATNAYPGPSMLVVSYSGRTFSVVYFRIVTITTITPLSDAMYIYVPVAEGLHEALRRAYFFITRTLRKTR